MSRSASSDPDYYSGVTDLPAHDDNENSLSLVGPSDVVVHWFTKCQRTKEGDAVADRRSQVTCADCLPAAEAM